MGRWKHAAARSLWIVILVDGRASAGPPVGAEPDTRRMAETLFREGRRAAVAGEYAAACAKFGESQALDPSTGTLLNLGDCEEHMGHMLSSRNYYQTALAQLGASDPRVRHARRRLEALEDRLPRLTITLAADAPPGVTVSRDETAVPLATFGRAVPIDPGEHVIVVTAPRHKDRREIIVLAERQSREVIAMAGDPDDESAGMPPSRPPAASFEGRARPGRPPPPSVPSLARTAGWIAGGIGVTGLAMAGVSGFALIRDESTVTDVRHCNAQKQCDAVGVAAASNAKSWLPVNTASWAVAVAGMGAGAYLLLSSTGASSNRAVVVDVRLTPLSGGIAIDAAGHF